MSKTKGIVIQQQGKNTPSVKPQHWPSINTTRVSQLGLDEFKYGFPSEGLAIVSHKWWESNSDDIRNYISVDGGEKSHEPELKSENSADYGDDVAVKDLETEKDESDGDLRGTGLLSHLRKRAAKEGEEALRLGVYRRFGVSKMGKKERKLLSRVFKYSLPSNPKTVSSDS